MLLHDWCLLLVTKIIELLTCFIVCEESQTDERSSHEFNCSTEWICCRPSLCVRYCTSTFTFTGIKETDVGKHGICSWGWTSLYDIICWNGWIRAVWRGTSLRCCKRCFCGHFQDVFLQVKQWFYCDWFFINEQTLVLLNRRVISVCSFLLYELIQTLWSWDSLFLMVEIMMFPCSVQIPADNSLVFILQ